MKPLERNISILEHIVGYCDQIEETIRRFGNDYGVFSADAIYRNAAALCELAGKLIAMALLIRKSLGKF